MKNIFLLSAMLLLLVTSCKKDNDEEDDIKYNGEVTLSSEIFQGTTYYSYGFSFEEEKMVSTLNPPVVIDITLNRDGQFTTKEIPGTTYGLYLNGTFNSAAEALAFYNNYLQAVLPAGVYLTDTVRANQVYTLRTHKKNYVKILVKELSSDTTGTPHLEALIKYFIQRDGSATFAE